MVTVGAAIEVLAALRTEKQSAQAIASLAAALGLRELLTETHCHYLSSSLSAGTALLMAWPFGLFLGTCPILHLA